MGSNLLGRRDFLWGVGVLGCYGTFSPLLPAWATSDGEVKAWNGSNQPLDLTIDSFPFVVNGRTGSAIAINGSVPGPIIRLKEGEDAVIRVSNKLAEPTSIHWHGIILPPEMDGVPGVSFAGIKPGETFTYRFPVTQSGTYWCHSHSGGQELLGVYAPLIIDPREPEPFHYDRDYIVVLSDWSFESPMKIMGRLKNFAGYYNYNKRTVTDLFQDIKNQGLSEAVSERLMWGKMNMDPTDIADVTGATYTYLLNGLPSSANWTALFRPGERVRLRFIDAAAMTLFDVRIPGLRMTLVQADGQNVQPVVIEEFRIGPGETYDVIVEPGEKEAYTVFAEAMDRSGWAQGTLALRDGLTAPVPERRNRPLRSMADMGMDMKGMADSGAHGGHGAKPPSPNISQSPSDSAMSGESMNNMKSHESQAQAGSEMKMEVEAIPGSAPVKHSPDHHGIGNAAVAEYSKSRLHEPGTGLDGSERRVLVYTDLKSAVPGYDKRAPEREIELHITGNMERYMWSFDGNKYSEDPTPIRFQYGERLRLTLVNDTMMEHPMHLHGMWMELENGAGAFKPRKHTIIIKPAERWSVAITADAKGKWAFHCHLLLHMEMGMFRVVEVSDEGHGGHI